MKQELFNPQSSSVYLLEVGSFESLSPHVSKKSNLVSFLCFVVLSGRGQLSYAGEVYKLAVGDCVFIDCQKVYDHSTSYTCEENCDEDLWSLQWCHFYVPSLPNVYKKYRERGGHPVFHLENVSMNRKQVELSAIKTYLDEHYAEKIMLDNLAEHFFINKFYMTKIFKEKYGTTIVSYLIKKNYQSEAVITFYRYDGR